MKNKNNTDQIKLLSSSEINELTGRSRATIYRWVRSGNFPAPLKIGPNSVAWTQEQYLEWLESKEVAKH